MARIFLTVIFSSLFTNVHLVIGECPPGKYGVDCRYDCHCESGITCDPTSGCNPTVCSSGWSGSTCQKENVALNGPAVQSSTWAFQGNSYPAGYAVDGRVGHDLFNTPCTHTEANNQPTYWSVTLSQAYQIFGFTIYNRDSWGHRLNNFTLSVGNTSTQIYKTCYQDQTTSKDGPGKVIRKNCQNEMTIVGNSVKISLNAGEYLTLCEIQVFACSSGTWGTDCEQYCHCWNGVPCSVKIGSCPVNGRDPICTAGYNGAQCNTECPSGRFGPDCSEACGNCAKGSTSCDRRTGECPLTANGTRCLAGYGGTLCKTVCQDGKHGPDCSEACGNCVQGSTSCDRTTGECPLTTDGTRCLAGYGGPMCKTTCQHGQHGPDCSDICGNCAGNGTSCDKRTGECALTRDGTRCLVGYGGLMCKTVCSDENWGVDCTGRCGHCWNNSACHKETGECPVTVENPLCSAGFLGEGCNQRCSKGTWGENCKLTCSVNCKLGPTGCDVTSGECFEGCREGYSGKYCENSTPVSQVDYTSTIVGSVVGVIVAAFLLALLIFFLKRNRGPPQNQAHTEEDHSSKQHERSVQYLASHEKEVNLQTETQHYESMPEENPYERVSDRNPSQEPAYTHLA